MKKINSPGNVDFDEVVSVLKDLIGIESPYFHESEIMDYVSKWLSFWDIPNYIQEYHEEKVTNFKGKNVISIIDSGKQGPTVYLNGHLDTVLLCSGWTKDPYKGEIEGDRIYGLGALDMKGGCATIMVALKLFRMNVKVFTGKIITSFVSDEEGPYGLGSDAVIEAGLTDNVDVSIVTEPSAGFTKASFPCLCLGARGGYGLSVEFFGKSAHAATPELGINAAVEAAKMMVCLSEISYIEDPWLGKGNLCVVKVESDGGACSVPDYARVQFFRHTVSGETKQTIIDELDDTIKRAGICCGYKISFREAPSADTEAFLPYTVDEQNPYVKLLKTTACEVTGTEPSVSYFQSIGDFNYLGTRIDAPCIIFGAEGEKYHGTDEYVTISSLTQTTAVLYDYLKRLLCQ